ncbi:hypothetical protein DICPUDRAFT_80557 [Dictyostelium purpureum]|uniref:Uncharacterized protein n=1 Tax=Dictyostelium purpureum TaxID=5786 RepID=F0ZQU8_DICPU|nr:uncharacterized protein DICPUDRAFT_80557 [Dictyostelium purpureum]EGC33671.1 hypothetical protein DICPUDRAFT_80557 [Dictyostelium purpureum]|eukprot:XP_003289790.1 hypothetical protein DICPUDRAFT_80557 [Dictyostelium purpureum]
MNIDISFISKIITYLSVSIIFSFLLYLVFPIIQFILYLIYYSIYAIIICLFIFSILMLGIQIENILRLFFIIGKDVATIFIHSINRNKNNNDNNNNNKIIETNGNIDNIVINNHKNNNNNAKQINVNQEVFQIANNIKEI